MECILKKAFLYSLILLTGFAGNFMASEDFTNEREHRNALTASSEALESYEKTLQTWKTPENINTWIASNFSYYMNRSFRLSETQVTQKGPPTIHTPSEFFSIKSGTCVDLSRFAVETMKIISPQYDAKYIMIEFEPITINGDTLRRHWLVSFKHEGRKYFFADSNRPGHIAGPFNEPEGFIREYERYRGRRIVAFREMESYQKDKRIRTLKQNTQQRP
jgi:hypothetical protein